MPERRLTVLVLGVGGNVSQGILKALALADLPHRLVAACTDPMALGLRLADAAHLSPLAADPAFPGWLAEVCEDEGVDAVLSGVEPVLEAMAAGADELRERTGAVCVVSPPALLEVGQDKLTTGRWLAERGLRAPRSADASDAAAVCALAAECGYPLVVKPRRGRGAIGVAEIATPAELDLYAGREGLLVQERLAGDEFTVGCFCDRDGRLRGSVAMRRELAYGTTVRAESGAFPEARAEAERIAAELRPVGPLNVQLRMTGDGPVAFELNVRFSGTTPIRARLGFNEVEAALRQLVLGEPPADLPEAAHRQVVRYWNEAYLPASPGDPPLVEDWGVASASTMSPRRDEFRK